MKLRLIIVSLLLGIFGLLAMRPGFNPFSPSLPRPPQRFPDQAVDPVRTLATTNPERYQQLALKGLQACLPQSGQAGLDNPQVGGIVIEVMQYATRFANREQDPDAQEAMLIWFENETGKLTRLQQLQLEDLHHRLQSPEIQECFDGYMIGQALQGG